MRLNPPTATVGHLPQEPERREGESVRAFLARRTGVSAAQADLDVATEALTAGEDGSDDLYATALDRWLALGGADLDDRAAEVAADLGLAIDLDQLMTSLSGGQAARAGLASLLLSRYDVFLLDEPTNDLDLDGLARLERFVTGLRSATVLVSHDREFLARTVDRVVELDLAQQQVNTYGGGYDAYLEEREVARRHAREDYDEFAGTKAALEARGRMQRGWMEKGVKNARRKAPDNDKIGRKFRSEATEKQASKARQTERMIERLDVVDEPRKEWELRMEIAAAPRAGAVVATLRGAVVRRGGFTLGPVDLQVDWADKVAITGANGAGKSTLLAVMLGRTRPRTKAMRRSVRASWSARSTRRASCSSATARSRTPSRVKCRSCPTPTSGRCWRSSGSRPRTCCGPPRRCRRGSAPARRSRCCRRAASTCWCSTSRPTTSTCPRSSSSRRRWTATRARCCW